MKNSEAKGIQLTFVWLSVKRCICLLLRLRAKQIKATILVSLPVRCIYMPAFLSNILLNFWREIWSSST